MPETSLARSRPEEQSVLAGSLGLDRGVLGFIPRTHCPQPTAQSKLVPSADYNQVVLPRLPGAQELFKQTASREFGAVDGRGSGLPSLGLPSEEPSDQRLGTSASTYPTCHRLLQRAWGGHLRGQRHLEQVGYLLAHSTAPAFPSAWAGLGLSPPSPSPLPAPASLLPRLQPLTGPRGHSCRPRNPASPVGTRVSLSGAGPNSGPPHLP